MFTRSSHGANETGVQNDQRRARNDVDKNHPQPVVYVVVDRLVALDERRELVLTSGDFDSRRTAVVD